MKRCEVSKQVMYTCISTFGGMNNILFPETEITNRFTTLGYYNNATSP